MWIEKEEKPTKYFCSLESRQYVSKLIPKLYNEDGSIVSNTKDILEKQVNFYSNLYSNSDRASDLEAEQYLNCLEGPKLSETNASQLEGKRTYKELANSLNQMKNNKSPGLDGFSAEFFKFFLPKCFILRSINEAVDNGNLSISQRRGVITCLQKETSLDFMLKIGVQFRS